MKSFESEILIYCIVATIAIIAILLLLDKYTDYLKERGQSLTQNIVFVLIMATIVSSGAIEYERETLQAFQKAHINPVKATARVERKMPYGIRIYLQDANHSTYQFDLENTDLNKEFIEEVNNGYTVSKFRNSTDILLTNGTDSTYYNLYY